MGVVGMSNGNKCPICGKLDTDINSNGINDPFYHFNCVNCGRFFAPSRDEEVMSEDVIQHYYNIEHLKSYLFYHKTNLRPVICNKNYFDKHITDDYVHIYNVTPEMVENWYPKSFAEKIDLILLKLSEMAVYDGDFLDIYSFAKPLFFVTDKKSKTVQDGSDKDIQVEYIIDYLEKQEYVVRSYGVFQLTHKALERVYELQKNQSNNKNVFIAMKFGEETKALREKIKEGLKGYNVRIMDEIEHNHQIVPEMLYEIKNSRFVIAELSHHNNGAYYEAGYALGLGKEVIHICDKNELKSGLHFDVSQVNTICYDSIDEIPEKLKKRIEATIK